jgi:hypothetical protein
MGYIQKNNTQAFLVTRVTDVGRRKIAEGNFNIKYFQIGDSEVNYTANTLSTYNLFNLNILEPAFNAHNNTGIPQSNKNEIKYPYYLQGYSGSTYGIPFSDPIVDEVFNTATPLGFFSAGTNCYYVNYGSAYTYNSRFAIPASQFNSDTLLNMTVSNPGCLNASSNSISSNTIVFVALNNTNCTNCFSSCYPVLTYRVNTYNNATVAITTDRATPNLPTVMGAARALFYKNNMNGFDVTTPYNYFDTLNQDVINYESICSPYDGHVKIWNMNIPWSENPAGVNGAGGPTNYPSYTSYGSVNYLSTKEYYGYQSSLGQFFQLPDQSLVSSDTYYYNSSGDRIYVEPEEQKAIAILHYTNNSVINFYGEKFATEAFNNGGVGEARNFKVVIPHIMWHKNSNLCNGLTLYIDPPGFNSLDLCRPHFVVSKKNEDMNNPGIRYFHLYDTNANPDGYPNRVGKVFPDDKLIIIDDEELIASLTYVANRNYTLPAPKLSLVTPTTAGILYNENQCLWVTYALSSGWNGLHCNYYSKILGPLSSCTSVSQNVDVIFDGNFGGLVNWNSGQYNGFPAEDFYMLVQSGTTGSIPNPTQWKRIDFTTELQNAGAIVNGYISQNGINTFTFNITPSKYQNAPFYNLSSQIQIPTISQLNQPIKPLNFGDEYFFYGTINTDIEATIYQMRYLINLPTNQFIKPSNPSWSDTINVQTRMTEVGLYDGDKNLLVLSKFQSPEIRQGVQQVAIKLDF